MSRKVKKTTPEGSNPFALNASVPALPDANTYQAGQAAVGKIDSKAPTEVRLPRRLPDERNAAIPFGRLLGVEFRKLTDTRGGKWLIIAMVVLILLASALLMFSNKDQPVEFVGFIMATAVPMGFILPVLGIMAVTTEWSQRSGLVTFTLEPRRLRVGFAKWLAALAMGVIGTIIAYLVAAAMTAIGSLFHTGGAHWDVTGWAVAGTLLAFLLAVSQGVAFGMLIQNTPGAICAYLFIPMIVSIITSTPWFKDVGQWIDPSRSSAPLYTGSMTGDDWKHLVVSQLIWLVIPLVLGMWRLTRREVKSA